MLLSPSAHGLSPGRAPERLPRKAVGLESASSPTSKALSRDLSFILGPGVTAAHLRHASLLGSGQGGAGLTTLQQSPPGPGCELASEGKCPAPLPISSVTAVNGMRGGH